MIRHIGKQINDDNQKEVLRKYYKYRVAESEEFVFPEQGVIQNVLVFLMKIAGHDQIEKMLIQRNIGRKHISFMLWGSYVGFANMPKTFTDIVFKSSNQALFEHIDDYLFTKYLHV